MCDDDKFGSLEVYTLCATIGSLDIWKFRSLRNVLDDDKFASSQVLKFGGSHVLCDDDKFGSSEVYMLRVMMIGLEVWKFTCCV